MISFVWNGLKLTVSKIGGGTLHGEIATHAHSKNSYELHYITAGRGVLRTDSAEYPLQAGNFFITGPQVMHAQISDEKSPMQDIFIYLQREDAPCKNAVGLAFAETHFWFCEKFPDTVLRLVFLENRDRRVDYETAVSGLLQQLLTEIVRYFLPAESIAGKGAESLNDRRFWIIENAFLFDEHLTLRSLSEKIGLCERQTDRLLQKYYGKGFREMKTATGNAVKSKKR